MEFFKKTPLSAALAGATVLVLLVGAFLAYNESSRLDQERELLASKIAQIQSLENSKPYPDQTNIAAAQAENKELQGLLAELRKTFAVQSTPLSPQAFQDELNKSVGKIEQQAAEKGVALPDGFYLGFGQYRTELPPASIAGDLGVQLKCLRAAASVLIDSGVDALVSFEREPLPGEASLSKEGSPQKKEKPDGRGHDLRFARFDVSFVAKQSAFRLAFNRILEIQPPVFVKLVAVTNSSPSPPMKANPASDTASGTNTGTNHGIIPIVGREKVTVSLGLAGLLPSQTN